MTTEKEKMLAGQLYDASDLELTRERDRAKGLMHEFNLMHPNDKKKGLALLSTLLKAEEGFQIEAPFYFDYGYNIKLGDNFYANHGLCILDVCEVTIGNNVMCGPFVQIYAASHPVDPDTRLQGLESGSEVIIGNNVWLGGGCIIRPGIKIGDNVTVGAGSVVTKDIPANVFAAGNPCKVIRKL